MKFEKKQYIPMSFASDFEKVNEEFIKCTISVNSYDQIANGTKFRKEAIEKALPTLNYCPVIGYLKDDGTMGGHGIEYKITESGNMEEVVKTVPFGVVIKDSYRFEKLQKANGEYEEYVVCDAYLWNRYQNAVNIVKENRCNQSMEVSVLSGEYSDLGYYDISEFNYSAICILGEDVEPAFALAKIRTSDKFSKDEFKACYSEMTKVLDKFLNFEEGGENSMEDGIFKKKKRKCSKCGTEVETDKEVKEDEEFICDACLEEGYKKKKRKCSKCETEIEVEGTFDEKEEFVCDTCLAEYKKKKRKCSKCGTEVEVDDSLDEQGEFICDKCADEYKKKKRKCSKAETEEKLSTFELSFEDIKDKLTVLISSYGEYSWVVEMFNDRFIYAVQEYNQQLYKYDVKFYKQNYLIDNDEVLLSGDPIEVFTEFLTKEEITIIEEERTNAINTIDSLQYENSKLNEEIEELKAFKANVELEEYKLKVDEELSKYSELESIEGYSELIKNRYTANLEELIKEIKVFAYDNSIVLNKKSNKKNFSKETKKIPLSNTEHETAKLSAWNTLDKYIAK